MKSGKLINATQRSHVFKTGHKLVAATVASEVESKPVTMRKVETKENAKTKQHTQGLLKDVRKHTPPDVSDEVGGFLTKLADVFATTDLHTVCVRCPR